MSATIKHDRILKTLGDNVSIWEVTISGTPNNDFLKTEALLSDFRITVRSTFDKIKYYHGCTDLHIFPAMPVSASVELGRVWMPKDFYKTITIK